jgi:hypothetical protein
MPLPSEGELSIKDLQQEATIPDGNTNDFVEMAEVYDIDNFNVNSPQDIVLADDFYGEEVNLTATSITLNPTLLTFPSSGGNLTTNLSLNGFALMVGKPGWLTTEKTYLKTSDAGSIQFTAGQNDFLGSSPRSKAIQFIGQSSNVYRTLIVSQSGNPVEISLTPSNSQTIAANTTTFTQDVTVTNPLEVFGSVTGSGFTLSSPSVTNLGSTSRYRFTLTQDVNTGGVRQAELNFDISGSNFIQQRSVTHSQSAFAANVSVSPTSFDFNINGETKLFVVTANTDWEVFTSGGDSTAFQTSITSVSSGFSTTTKNGTGNGTNQTYNVWVKVGNNSAGGTNDRSTTLIVRERPWGGGGAFGNSSLTQDGNPLPSFIYSDAQVSGFSVATNGAVTAPTSANGTPISVTYSTGYSNGSFPAPVSSNTTRYAYVNATVPSTGYSNSGGIVSGTESATQSAPQEFITISSSTGTGVSGQGESFIITVNTEDTLNTQWTAEISYASPSNSSNWVSLSAGSQGTGDGSFFVTVSGNYSGQTGYNGSTRYFDIRVYKNNNYYGLFDSISFSQSTGTPPVSKPTFSVTPSSDSWTYSQSGTGATKVFTASYTGGNPPTSVSFYISGTYFALKQYDQNVPLGFTGPPWVASATNTSGVSSYSVQVYPVNQNSNVADNTENMSVSMGNSGGTTTVSVPLTHSGQRTWSISPTSITVNYSTGNSTVTLTTNLSWSAVLDPGSYSTFALSGGNSQTGTGNKSFLITRGTNNRSDDVTGTLTLTSTTSGTSESTTISLTQNPEPPDLQLGLNTSTTSTTALYQITPSTNGQSYSLYVKHDPSRSGTVTFSITYENSPHVGLATYSATTSGAGGNVITATVSGTNVVRYLNFASNPTNSTREAITRISSNIASNTIQINSSYGSGGAECILKGTKVKLADGSLINVEELNIGQILFSKLVDTMPIKNEEDALSWVSEDLSISDDEVSLVGMTLYKVENIYNFNSGLIKTTPDHLHFVKKQNLYQVVKAQSVFVGDYLIKEDGTEVEIISKILETGYYTVYKLDVEENDLFIANGLITHNAKGIEV